MTFLSGILLFFLGIIGEYVGRVYEEIKARPLYVVRRHIGRTFARRQGRGSSPASRSDGVDTPETRPFASVTYQEEKG